MDWMGKSCIDDGCTPASQNIINSTRQMAVYRKMDSEGRGVDSVGGTDGHIYTPRTYPCDLSSHVVRCSCAPVEKIPQNFLEKFQ
jgi:hypothetical protein